MSININKHNKENYKTFQQRLIIIKLFNNFQNKQLLNEILKTIMEKGHQAAKNPLMHRKPAKCWQGL